MTSQRDRLDRERARRAKSAAVGGKATVTTAHRPYNRKRPGERIEIAIMPSLCCTEGIEEAKKATHDRLIEGLGRRRRSGVKWHILEGAEAILAHVRDEHADDREFVTAAEGWIDDALLRGWPEDDLRFVVAMCEAIR